ncbi:hypothetical protein DT076_12040 [Desertihabitans brevis]|uniref:CN hydrolase domain-containing protein n=1 Tax=Desertihabitans brevis TaxID=2268447 RepID=A0A367YTD7_9ACTN|nr:nitrilase-related carbon-nitrogen hydrolase [Desertihabitans brevis]RCK69078.1 hypothetical protein DT076_12040 [Desertihabitans brevis]
MRLALAQCAALPDAAPGDQAVRAAVAAVADAVAEAAGRGADLLATSELVIGGYRADRLHRGELDTVLDGPDDARLQPLREAVRTHRLDTLVGAAVATGSGVHNALLLLTADGSVRTVFAKVHLWGPERTVFTAGQGPVLLEHSGLRTGLGICYDAGFPEYARALARHADLLLFSSAYATGEEERRYDVYHPARALESGVHVAVVNAVGRQGGAELFGRSQHLDPWGRVVAEAGPTPGVLVTDVDVAAVREARADLTYLADLHPQYRVTTVGRTSR